MKQIEEMARKIVELYKDPPQDIPKYDLNIATYLYDAGYRKQSDVAREIFEHIEKLSSRKEMPITTIALFNTKEYAELKKKYSEVEK